MNGWAFAAAAALPAMVLITINVESMHAYYAYSLPVAGSTVEIYDIVYVDAEEEYYKYYVNLVFALNSTVVSEYAGKESPSYMMAVSNITLLDDGAILVGYGGNDYKISGSNGAVKWRMPKFSHSETIQVNQTFVALCIDLLNPGDPEYRDSTSIVILQYRGIEEHEAESVTRYHYVGDNVPEGSASRLPDGTFVSWFGAGGIVPEGAGVSQQGDSMYITTREQLSSPVIVPVHKFLFMSAHTHSKMPCDYPQVIEHTVDSKRIGAADIRAVSDALYQWYR